MKYEKVALTLAFFIGVAAISLAGQEQVTAQLKDADMTVYGIHLGEKFSVPECPRPYDIMRVSTLCFMWELFGWDEPPKPGTPVTTAKVAMYFPELGTPGGLVIGAEASHDNLPGPIEGQIVDGNVEIISLYTEGLKFQDLLLATLKEKYGEPSAFEEKSKENDFGAIFTSHSGTWHFKNLLVVFEGTLDRTDVGYITICTNKGGEFLKQHPQKTAPIGPKM